MGPVLLLDMSFIVLLIRPAAGKLNLLRITMLYKMPGYLKLSAGKIIEVI
jgi:hypothetical protein